MPHWAFEVAIILLGCLVIAATAFAATTFGISKASRRRHRHDRRKKRHRRRPMIRLITEPEPQPSAPEAKAVEESPAA